MKVPHFIEVDPDVTTEDLRVPIAVAVWGAVMFGISIALGGWVSFPAEFPMTALGP
jgi:hypothetical protein